MVLPIAIGVVVIVIAVAIFLTAKRNNEIREKGIETNAVVTRVREDETTDEDGHVTGTTYTYFVTYVTQDGKSVEARLASGKSLDVRVGSNVWDKDLYQGCSVRIKYLPDKPDYVIRVQG